MSESLSVIIPVFNGARFIEQALASVSIQDHEDLQVIVVDDASTDATREILHSRRDITLLELPTNSGPSTARNRGLEVATGEFIAFIDADDTWVPGKVRLQLDWLRRHPGSGFVTGLHETFMEPGCKPPPWAAAMMGRDSAGVVPSAWLMRRAVFDLVGPFDPTYRHAEDVDWLTRASQAGVALESVGEVVFRKRVHDTNLTLDHQPSHAGLVRALRASAIRQRANQPR